MSRSPLPPSCSALLARTLVLGLALAPCMAVAMGTDDRAQPPTAPAPDAPRMTPEMLRAGLLSAHPDLKWRLNGMAEYEAGRHDLALPAFKRAARHADKPSAAMVAELYWAGQGVEADRPLAYAWMDLAAERGWKPFLVRREGMWAELSEVERARALDVGKGVYAEFGDAVAKPRKERALNRAKRNITGSRVGFVGNLAIEVPGPGGTNTRIRGEDFYHPTLWRADRYWAWQESIWREPRVGTVDVGAVSVVEGSTMPPAAAGGDPASDATDDRRD